MTSDKIAIIPARGGSKRLPRKNIREFLGKPVLAYPLKAALDSKLFESVVISTEDQEIATAAASLGAEVLKRPRMLAGDRASVVEVCLHVLEQLERQQGSPEIFCSIYATAVFLKPDDLRKSVQLLQGNGGGDFVMGVSHYNLQPVQAMVDKAEYLSPMWPEYLGVQSQDQEEMVASNGTLYWARSSAFLREGTFYGKRLRGYLMPRIRSVDLDTPEDLHFAKVLAPHVFAEDKDL